MNIRETSALFRRYYASLNFVTKYESEKNNTNPYYATDLSSLREAILNLEDIDILKNEIEVIKNTSLFKNSSDAFFFSSTEDTILKNAVNQLKIGIDFLLRYALQIEVPENGLNIKLPEIENFDDLAKVSKEFKKAIEIPIIDQQQGGQVKIETADSGSIWLTVSVGSIAAVNLVAAICWSAAVIRKKMAEARIFEAQAKTLELKNEMMETLIEALKVQTKNILDSEAKEIANNHYNLSDGEAIARLKLSIETVSELIDKGVKILPTSDDSKTAKLFPDYSALNLIESSIRQLKNGS